MRHKQLAKLLPRNTVSTKQQENLLGLAEDRLNGNYWDIDF